MAEMGAQSGLAERAAEGQQIGQEQPLSCDASYKRTASKLTVSETTTGGAAGDLPEE
jgi:hypothetical protein